MAEVCPVIIGAPESDTVISGVVERAYTINVTSEDFCNPSSNFAIYYDGTAIYDGFFVYGGAGVI